MSPVRVLVVDDSVVIRRLVTNTLDADPAIQVVGTAANGRLALDKLAQLRPDVVTLDVEMPVLGGLDTLVELRRDWPKLPVVMFSTLTERGAATTLEALSLGASDYVTKPSSSGNLQEGLAAVRAELVPKLLALCPDAAAAVGETRDIRPRPARVVAPEVPRLRAAGPLGRVDVIAIGVSTGGPNALAEVLAALPADLPVPIVIVQHMPRLFTKLLADRLDGKCAVRVGEAVGGEALSPGQVWIAPGGLHLEVERRGTAVVTRVHDGPLESSCRPAVDPLFRSVAAAYGGSVLGVVLTGMGQDGLRGAEAIVAAGGRVLAQDEATSVVWGMPGYIGRSGLADALLPIGDVANELVRRAAIGRTVQMAGTRS